MHYQQRLNFPGGTIRNPSPYFKMADESSSEIPSDRGSLREWANMTLPESEREFNENVPKVNTASLVGRAGADPTIKEFDESKMTASFSIAVPHIYHPYERSVLKIEPQEQETDWFLLEMWDSVAKYASKAVKKGTRVGVTGSLVVDDWTDKEGNARKTPKLVVRTLEVLETKSEVDMRKSADSNFKSRDDTSNSKYGDQNDEDDLPAWFDQF